MNNLITSDVKMTSLDIAEVIGKQHQHVLRDIRKEIDRLGTEIGQSIFGRTSYTDKSNREMPCYEFGKDGLYENINTKNCSGTKGGTGRCSIN